MGGTHRRDSRKTSGDSVGIPAIHGGEDVKEPYGPGLKAGAIGVSFGKAACPNLKSAVQPWIAASPAWTRKSLGPSVNPVCQGPQVPIDPGGTRSAVDVCVYVGLHFGLEVCRHPR